MNVSFFKNRPLTFDMILRFQLQSIFWLIQLLYVS